MKRILSLLLMALIALGGKIAMSNPQVEINTTMGSFVVEVDEKNAPISAANFLSYVKSGFYNDTIFHRVIPNFMIQGGGMTTGMNEKANKAAIKNEANNGLKNVRGSVAMARTNAPHSATSQFFINTKDNVFLNHTAQTMQGWGYTVFAKVVEGMDTVDKIEKVKTGNRGHHGDVPVADIIINEMSLKK